MDGYVRRVPWDKGCKRRTDWSHEGITHGHCFSLWVMPFLKEEYGWFYGYLWLFIETWTWEWAGINLSTFSILTYAIIFTVKVFSRYIIISTKFSTSVGRKAEPSADDSSHKAGRAEWHSIQTQRDPLRFGQNQSRRGQVVFFLLFNFAY